MSERDYRIVRQPETGQFLYVERNSDGRRFLKNGPEFEEFIAWNERQERPLNIAHWELPKGHVVTSDTKEVVETCRQRGITLFVEKLPNGMVSMKQMNNAIFPECQDKGRVYQLCEPKQSKDGLDDGIEPRPAPIWVTQEMLTEAFPPELLNPDSEVRRISTWPIMRTFVYLDISDFSKAPPGQELLIVNSLVRALNEPGHWIGAGHGLPEKIEARLCIGDGYIFVFKEAMSGAYFAAYLAHLIEVLIANHWLAVDFHFRMGVHCGPVYTFWDQGRGGWNYIGEGINGGNRVLSAMGKTYDDTVYISAEVRQGLMATVDSAVGRSHLLQHLHNRGRQLDKHGRPWRVYEVNHSAVCSNDLPTRLFS